MTDPFPLSLYSWTLPEDMHGHMTEYIADGTLPNPNILIWGVCVGVVFTVMRMVLNVLILKPMAYKAMHLQPPKDAEPVAALDRIYHPKKRPGKEELEAACKDAGIGTDVGEAYLLKKVHAATVRSRVYKFAEATWRASLYAFMVVVGVYATVGQPWWGEPFKQTWVGWPRQTQPELAYQYYALTMGVYVHLMIFQVADTKRSDFWQHALHHLVTMFLIVLSWVTNFVRVGTLVILLHDVSDVPLEVAKLFNYTKAHPRLSKAASTGADILFAIFALTFLTTRLGLYPYFILYNTLFVARDAAEYVESGPPPCPPCYYIFNFMLIMLQALHILWACLILRMVYKVIVLNYLEDIRSDSEGEWEEVAVKKAPGKLAAAAAANGTANGNGKQKTG